MTTLANSISGPGSRASSSVAESDDLGADSSLKERFASQSDVDKFEAAIQEKSAKRENAQGNAGHGERPTRQDELSSIFSSLMQSPNQVPDTSSMLGTNLGPDQTLLKGESVTNSTAPTGNTSLQELADNLVERILVSDPKFSGGSEVRLLLGQNTGPLSGSEIILRRDLEGMLAVEINCRNKDQVKKFVEIRGDLTEALESHEKSGVNLIINDMQEDLEAQSEGFYHAFSRSSF